MIAVVTVLLCANAYAQPSALSVDIEALGDRPAELSTPERPYVEVLRDGLAGILASFTNARSCERATARSLLFADVSASDSATQRLTQNGARLYNERVHAEMCGAQFMPNYYVLVTPGQPTWLLEGTPGRTRASPLLQGDVQPQVLRVARALAQCAEPNVIGVAHTIATPADASGAWSETWIVSACGRRVDIPLNFTPAQQGGIDCAIKGDQARVQ
ncbi:MAG: hypothetical protein M0D54_09590 [Hyphomonadaceae bacterium JAD_PAG50586_4]|nr:MAG: hypothetical protein M0D54_09590 [Hyphomonadaceae bacterium JAD_PAG50586_4]